MRVDLNRETKAYCPDFTPVRQLLSDLGATFGEVKEQVDFFYYLPPIGDGEETRRLRLRVEKGEEHLLYFYDRQDANLGISSFQLLKLNDPQIKSLLDVALGVRLVVRKQREIWRKENVVFHLDKVEGLGQIFEIEAVSEDGRDINQQVEDYQRRFDPYLGSYIAGSNEDLLSGTG